MNKEIWKSVEGFERYEVSSYGRIKNIETDYILKPKKHPKGYVLIGLHKDLIKHTKKIHRLVGEAFIKNPKNKPQINHINGVKNDNNVDNLEWCTQSENMQHGMALYGKHHYASMLGKTGGKSPFSKKIIQLDLRGKVIKRWDCIREAARKNNWNHQNIIQNLKKKTGSAYGFVWKYEE